MYSVSPREPWTLIRPVLLPDLLHRESHKLGLLGLVLGLLSRDLVGLLDFIVDVVLCLDQSVLQAFNDSLALEVEL